MTDRDPLPATPPCPRCGDTEQAERLRQRHLGAYICLGCMLTYDGTTSEWERFTPQREATSGR